MITKLDKNIHNTSENIFKKNNLTFDSYFPSLIEKNYKELSFLNCKRINLNNQEKNTQNILDKNEKSFNFYLNEKMKNEFDLLKNLDQKKRKFFIFVKIMQNIKIIVILIKVKYIK